MCTVKISSVVFLVAVLWTEFSCGYSALGYRNNLEFKAKSKHIKEWDPNSSQAQKMAETVFKIVQEDPEKYNYPKITNPLLFSVEYAGIDERKQKYVVIFRACKRWNVTDDCGLHCDAFKYKRSIDEDEFKNSADLSSSVLSLENVDETFEETEIKNRDKREEPWEPLLCYSCHFSACCFINGSPQITKDWCFKT